MQVGDIRTWERTFTAKDARLFEQVSKALANIISVAGERDEANEDRWTTKS